jgi:alkanesulfonate monooxygenase SsuD/methylene tetrahydromethanopterin reductase-like flavin-dependent oxidoreductase (luciferase family)
MAPARPFTALRETVGAVDDLLAGEEVTVDGEIRVDHARIPWSPGRLPIAIAGRGPRVEALGIETADWVLLSGKPIAELPALTRRIRAGRPDPSTPPARIAWSTYLGWTPAMVEEIRPHFTYATVDMPHETRVALGVADAMAERIREVMLADGIPAAAHLVPDSVVQGSAVVGDHQTVIDRLAHVRETADPDLFVLALNGYAAAENHIVEAARLIAAAGFAPEEH